MVNVGTRDARRRDAFLSGLATGQSVSVAASACGISRASVYRWRERSARFARQWDDAVEGGADLLEHEAWRRAVEGTARPVFAKGQQVGEVRQYSDRLLMFLLQAKRPQVYRSRPAASMRQPDIPEDLGRRVKAARERVRHAPPAPPRDVPARPIEDRPPDPPPRKDDDDDPPSSSAAFRARYGRYPTGYEVMKLGIKCFQAVDRQVTDDCAAAQREPSSSPAPSNAPVSHTNDGYLPHAVRSSSPTSLGRCPAPRQARDEGAEGSPRSLGNEDHVASPSAPHPELVEGRAAPASAQADTVPPCQGMGEKTRRPSLIGENSIRALEPSALVLPDVSRDKCLPSSKLTMRDGGEQAVAPAVAKDVKSGLARTLVRLCRAGIDAVLGRPRAGESIDGVSHVSHAVHRMPILRAFWRNDGDTDKRRTETKRPPMAALQRQTCLIPGLRLTSALPDERWTMARPA